jgi:hypothetical protein
MGYKRLETDAELLARAAERAGHEVKVGCCPPPPAPAPMWFGYWGLAAAPVEAAPPPDTADSTAERHHVTRRIVEEIPS